MNAPWECFACGHANSADLVVCFSCARHKDAGTYQAPLAPKREPETCRFCGRQAGTHGRPDIYHREECEMRAVDPPEQPPERYTSRLHVWSLIEGTKASAKCKRCGIMRPRGAAAGAFTCTGERSM